MNKPRLRQSRAAVGWKRSRCGIIRPKEKCQDALCGPFLCSSAPSPRRSGCRPEIARDANGLSDDVVGSDVIRSGLWPRRMRDPCPLETTVPGVLAAGDIRSGSTNARGFRGRRRLVGGDESASPVIDHARMMGGVWSDFLRNIGGQVSGLTTRGGTFADRHQPARGADSNGYRVRPLA